PRLEFPAAIPAALLIVLAGQYAFQWAMYFAYGVQFNFSYVDLSAHTGDASEVPYVLWQITVAVISSMLLVKQGLLLVLIRRWSSRPWRWTLIGWLTLEVIATVLQMGSRGPAMRLLISFAVLYHCFVRPIRARTVLLGGLALLIAFQIHGIVRLGNIHVR